MIELRENQIIQTKDGTNYILKHILTRVGGVLAVNENKYEFFVKFSEFKVILDPNLDESYNEQICRDQEGDNGESKRVNKFEKDDSI